MGLLNNFFLVDPLEQFLVLPFFFLGSLGISNLVFTFFLVSFFIILNFKLIKDEPLFVKNYFKFFFISLIDFVKTIAKENVQVKYFIFFPWFLILFLNILFCNLLGMVPYSFTVTSSIITTFYYSLSYFIALNVIGICLHYLQFLLLFLPPGTPAAIIPFLILLEILSYVARVFSLAIRLFANLMSGHTLLHILAGVAWFNIASGISKAVFVFIPWFIIFCITGLETVIGGMQAYVFIILLSIYLNDVICLH